MRRSRTVGLAGSGKTTLVLLREIDASAFLAALPDGVEGLRGL